MKTIIECVPNFSEGRDAAKVESIVAAILSGPYVHLLDQEMDADHNRSVVTFVGTEHSVGEAALRGMGRAAELIDLNHHQGAHPRLGSTDVVPFVPIAGATLEDCVRIAAWVAEQAWQRFGIPTYLYEAAARRPERRNLENIRRGQFEGVREEVKTDPSRRPDFGEAALHPTAGATVVGARKFLIAYNINLNTPEASLAKTIAKKIRASSGGFACVKAMGVDLAARGLAQVSMNLTDFETTPIGVVFDAVRKEASAAGAEVVESEIVGLVPRRAVEDAALHYLKLKEFKSGAILENRLADVLESAGAESQAAHPATGNRKLAMMAGPFLDAVAADTPTPGGGSVAAHSGAMAAALGEMVCRLTLRRKSLAAHHPAVEQALGRLSALRRRMTDGIDRDAASYDAVIAAMRLPKSTREGQAARLKAIEDASKDAALVPLQTAEAALETSAVLEGLRPLALPQATSDLRVALLLAEAGRQGAVENVRANLPMIQDRDWIRGIEERLKAKGGAS
ncbi:MAG TPA: glutamate formimidoyltransferase [Terriglobia bacterium]|nr:glutamate formimidoyltransferase [Terriglobia bacterium]